MNFVQLETQYAHSNGHTSVCFTQDGDHFLTCGSDGDVRIWKFNDLDDPTSECVGEMALAVAYAGDHFYIGSENHHVQAYTFPDAKRDGIVCRFTAPVTHIATSNLLIAAGSCDMEISVVEKADVSNAVKMIGHTGPVTGVAIDPLGKYLASSSCDGSVKIWDIKTGKEEKSLNGVIPQSNDYFRALILGRPTWESNSGRFLALPKEKEVALYVRDEWNLETCLSHPQITRNLSLTEFSPCGKFLAASSTSGELAIWDVLNHRVVALYEHPKKAAICCIAWKPDGKTLAVSDRLGQFSLIPCEFESIAPEIESEDIEDNDNEISLEKIKMSVQHYSDDEDAASSVDSIKPIQAVAPTYLQTAFQPSSTPQHLQQRFMVWNAIGIVRSFDMEDDKSIEVEFNDSTFHHQLHLKNYDNYSLAALSLKVLVLATDTPNSKLCGVFLNAWDGKKEWVLNLPETEAATALAASGSWIAVATDESNLRIFNYSGIQREILTLPGPVVCLAGDGNQLAVVFHMGLGLPDSQNLGFVIYDIGDIVVRTICKTQALPIGSKTTLKWAGFSDEGRFCTFDSLGVLRCLGTDMLKWIVIFDSRLQPKSPSDHYFVIGVSEQLQNLRCTLCKGSYYPVTMPRPILVEIGLKLPLCDPDSGKSTLEETFWRIMQFFPRLQLLAEDNPTYQSEVTEMEKSLKSSIVKLFANACKEDWNLRAVEIASLMSEQPLQKANTFAANCCKQVLLEKISEITPVDWNKLICLDLNSFRDDKPDFVDHGDILPSQCDIFADTPNSNVSGNKFLEAETRRGYLPTTPTIDNPFKIKNPVSKKTSNNKDSRRPEALESSRKKVVLLSSGPTFK